MNTITKIEPGKHANPNTQALIVSDYKSGKYTYKQICEKYGCHKDLVYRLCAGLDRSQIKKEIEAIQDSLNKEELLRELTRQGIDFKYVVKVLKSVFESDDNKDKLNAIDKYLKIQGYYADKGVSAGSTQATPSNLRLPGNSRD